MSTFLQGSSPVIHKSSLLRSTVTGRRTFCFDVRGERRSPEFIYLVVYMSTMLHWQTRVFLNYYSLESHIVVKLKAGTRPLHPRQYVKGETCTIVFLFIHSWLSSFDTFLYDFISCFSDTDISFQMVNEMGSFTQLDCSLKSPPHYLRLLAVLPSRFTPFIQILIVFCFCPGAQLTKHISFVTLIQSSKVQQRCRAVLVCKSIARLHYIVNLCGSAS